MLATGLHGHLLCLTNAFQTLQTWSLSRCCSKEVPGLPGMRGKICNTVSIGRGLVNMCFSVTRACISIGLLALSAHHCIENPSKSLSKFRRTYIDTSWQDVLVFQLLLILRMRRFDHSFPSIRLHCAPCHTSQSEGWWFLGGCSAASFITAMWQYCQPAFAFVASSSSACLTIWVSDLGYA